MSNEFSFVPINLGIWDTVYDRYPFKEPDDIGILERLIQRYKELEKVANVKISHKTSYEDMGKVDEFVWKLWTCLDGGQEDEDGGEEVWRISAKYLDIELSSVALTSLLRFMYTGSYEATLTVGVEILDNAKKLSLDSAVVDIINRNLTSKMNADLFRDYWMNPSSSLSIFKSQTFMDLSMAFIISHPLEIFVCSMKEGKTGFILDRKLMELLIPITLVKDIEKYKKISTDKWQCPTKQDSSGGVLYLDMNQDLLAEYLFHWAVFHIRKNRPSNEKEISLHDIQKELGDLVQLLDESKFKNYLKDYSDEDGVPVFSSMGSHYFFILSGSKCRDTRYRMEVLAKPFEYEANQPSNSESLSDFVDFGYSSTQEEIPFSQSSSSSASATTITSSQPPPKKKFKFQKSSSPILNQLKKAFDSETVSDVFFQTSCSSTRIRVSSFLLSLQSEKFFYYFKCNNSFLHNFYLGGVPLETAKDFFRMFYSASVPPNDTIVDCMKLSRHLEINSFLSRGYRTVIAMPLTVDNVTLQYCLEFACGDNTRAMGVLVPFIKRHLPLILNTDFLGTFETKDLLTHVLSMERTKKLEIGAILAVSRWLRYNFVRKDDPIYKRLVNELNFNYLTKGDLHKLLDDGFIMSSYDVVDLAFKLGAKSAK